MKVSIGSDHHGVLMRQKLGELVQGLGHEVIDHGPQDEHASPVDYPDVAIEVSRDVMNGKSDRGILICGTGIGMCVTANKFPSIRAATVNDELTAEISRRHNDLNVLCLSGDMLSEKAVKPLVEVWLSTPFDGGRHSRRIEKIIEIERTVAQGGNLDQLGQEGCSSCCDERC